MFQTVFNFIKEKIDMNRPILNSNLSAEDFRNFYYLKEELINFCKENNLKTSGSKEQLSQQIFHFLSTGEILSFQNTKKQAPILHTEIATDSIIEDNFVCSEKHRSFFKREIGKNFTFNVTFQKWLKNNHGKTYQDAIDTYIQIITNSKKTKTTIDKQFEYNTYIRDFFDDNKLSLKDAIKCWNYKKGRSGHNKYEPIDLIALRED